MFSAGYRFCGTFQRVTIRAPKVLVWVRDAVGIQVLWKFVITARESYFSILLYEHFYTSFLGQVNLNANATKITGSA